MKFHNFSAQRQGFSVQTFTQRVYAGLTRQFTPSLLGDLDGGGEKEGEWREGDRRALFSGGEQGETEECPPSLPPPSPKVVGGGGERGRVYCLKYPVVSIWQEKYTKILT